MSERINYEDDLFFVNSMLKTLSKGMSLDIDPHYFVDKIIEDIFFIDSTLNRIYTSLMENEYLIRRTDYLRNLLQSKKSYMKFLSEIIDGTFPISNALSDLTSKFYASQKEQRNDCNEISRILNSIQPEEQESEDIISPEEYQFLFTNNEEESSE